MSLRRFIRAVGKGLGLMLLAGAAQAAPQQSPPQQPSVPQTAAIEPDALVSSAREHLVQHVREIRPDVDRVEVSLMGRSPELRSVAGMQAVVPANAFHEPGLSARACVWVQLRRAGRTVGSVPVWFAVKAYRQVLVAQEPHRARDQVSANDFVPEERDVASLAGEPVEVGTELDGMRARRAIPTGRVLLKSDLEPLPQILRGQEVAVEVKYGAVAIETQAVAMREARLGESVTLQNPTSHMTYMARVVGQGRAAVVTQ